MNHTPGPWTYQRIGTDNYQIRSDRETVATVYATMQSDPDAPFDFNARLIAKAPEMLATIRDLIQANRNVNGLPLDFFPMRQEVGEATEKARTLLREIEEG